VCVLPHEFSLIHLHGFLTALPRPDSPLPRLSLVNAALVSVSWKLPHLHHWCFVASYPLPSELVFVSQAARHKCPVRVDVMLNTKPDKPWCKLSYSVHITLCKLWYLLIKCKSCFDKCWVLCMSCMLIENMIFASFICAIALLWSYLASEGL